MIINNNFYSALSFIILISIPIFAIFISEIVSDKIITILKKMVKE